MALMGKIDFYLKLVEKTAAYRQHNFYLLDIFKGALLGYVEKALRQQLSGQAAAIAVQRVAPINVLGQIVRKQSKIYSQGVTRSVVDGNTTDEKALQYLTETMKPTQKFTTLNRYFNLFKNGLIQPYLSSDGLPGMRVIPSDRFIPYSDDKLDPEKPTGFVLILDKYKDAQGDYCVYLAVEKDEFLYFTSRKTNVTGYFAPENPTGVNGTGVLPFVYLNREDDAILPTQDTDMMAMTLLIPVLMTDVNFAHMFQAFSIVYGINLNDSGIKFGPNAFWSFKTEPGSDVKPEIGTITPNADISGSLQLIANQFALWLNTKGLKAGAVGDVNGSNFASGIAKIMDEMDTSEDRNEQVPYFAAAEADFWKLLLNHMIPAWQAGGHWMGQPFTWSKNGKVITNFAEQVPLVRRGAVLDDSIKELDAGLTTRRRALKRLNPQMTDVEITKLEDEIDAEKETEPKETPPAAPPAAPGKPGENTNPEDEEEDPESDE